jgi:hypothetical protein
MLVHLSVQLSINKFNFHLYCKRSYFVAWKGPSQSFHCTVYLAFIILEYILNYIHRRPVTNAALESKERNLAKEVSRTKESQAVHALCTQFFWAGNLVSVPVNISPYTGAW